MLTSQGATQEFTEPFWLDTGYDGGLKLPVAYSDYLAKQGIQGWDEHVGTAGPTVPAKKFKIEVLEITGTSILRLDPPLKTTLFCFMNPPHLLGLDVLKKWIAEFDGPAKHLKLLLQTQAPEKPLSA